MTNPLMHPLPRAASTLGVTSGQMRALVRHGAIRARRIGARLYVLHADLIAYANSSTDPRPVTMTVPTMPRAVRPNRLSRHGARRPTHHH